MNKVVFFLQNLTKLCHQLPEDEVCAKNVHRLKVQLDQYMEGGGKKKSMQNNSDLKPTAKKIPDNWKSEYKDEIPKWVFTPLSPLTFSTGYQLKQDRKSSSQSHKVCPRSLTEERCFTEMDELFQIPTIWTVIHPSCQCHVNTCSSYFTL